MTGAQLWFLIQHKLFHLFWASIDILFPPVCAGCGIVGSQWCQDCHDSVLVLNGGCQFCGQMGVKDICSLCQQAVPPYTQARAWGTHKNKLRAAIHHLKYKHNIGLAEKFSDILLSIAQEANWEVDIVVAIPLAPKRKRERGYNQAELIAKPLAWQLGVSYAKKALRRVRETPTQVGLSRQERLLNVADAFLADSDVVNGKRILLIDDVMTSGATMKSASLALKSAGSAEIYVLTMSRPAKPT